MKQVYEYEILFKQGDKYGKIIVASENTSEVVLENAKKWIEGIVSVTRGIETR